MLLIKPLRITGVALGTFISCVIVHPWFSVFYIAYPTKGRVKLKKHPILNHATMVLIPFVLVGMLVTNYLQAGLGKIVIGIVIFLSFLPFGIMEVYADRNARQSKDYFSAFTVTK